MRHRAVAVVAFVSLVAIAIDGPVSAAAAGSDEDTAAQAVTPSEAIEFRTTFGFPADAKTIAATLADPSADTTFGTPLTKTEAANMLQRERLEALADPLEQFIDSHEKDFGGFYLTQNTGDLKFFIATTSHTPDALLDGAKALAPAGLSLTVVDVTFSMAELKAAQAQLVAVGDSIGLRLSGIDTESNSLVATVDEGWSPDGPSAISDVPVTVTTGPGMRLSSCWDICSPWRGGMNIQDLAFPAHGNCTWGYYGTRGTAAKYLLTAGHCGKIGHVEKTQTGVQITDGIDKNSFDDLNSAVADTQTGHVRANASAVAPFNTVIASSSDLSHPITVVKSNSQGIGATVCFFGFTTHSGSPCGVIEVVNVTGTAVRDDGKSLNLSDLVQMTKATAGGDSGGPVYSGLAAYGIVTAAGASGHMIYSKIVNASNLTAISLCVTTNC